MPEGSRSTILVVAHDDLLRNFTSAALADAKYEVLEAKGGLDGFSAMLSCEREIALAVVELKMPGIGGLDLANQIGIERPSTEVLYISDVSKSIAGESIAASRPEALLKKPFTAGQLLSRVRVVLRRRTRTKVRFAGFGTSTIRQRAGVSAG